MIYISYNEEDISTVNYLIQKLKQSNFAVWKISEQLLAGDTLPPNIKKGIEVTNLAIFCLGKWGLSKIQQTELKLILEEIKARGSYKIIPIILPNAVIENYPTEITELHQVNFNSGFENVRQWEGLIKSLNNTKNNSQISKFKKSTKGKDNQPKNIRAVSVALYFNGKILLIKRGTNQKSGKGLWQLPGGKVKSHEDSNEAAVRELEEEVGIKIEKRQLIHICDILDTWIVRGGDDFITMTLYLALVESPSVYLAEEFDKTPSWIEVPNLFEDSERIYFGSTGRFLMLIRRFIYIYYPLKLIAEELNNNTTHIVALPKSIGFLNGDSTAVLYSMLSILGFLNDKGGFTNSSTLSISLIKTLSEFSLTESALFEAEGSIDWLVEAQKKNLQEIERYRSGIFAEHKSLLGLLSYRLSKSLSSRNVCDLLIYGKSQQLEKSFILVRWDFFAKKFQIPAKGLESLESDLATKQVAEYVVKERLSSDLVDMFEYENIGPLKTSHVGSGTIQDGPLMTNYLITIFKLEPKFNFNNDILKIINRINENSISKLTNEKTLSDALLKKLTFYVWADVDYINNKGNKISLLGKKMQGFEEIVDKYGFSVFKSYKSAIDINEFCTIPVISDKVLNSSSLDFILKN